MILAFDLESLTSNLLYQLLVMWLSSPVSLNAHVRVSGLHGTDRWAGGQGVTHNAASLRRVA